MENLKKRFRKEKDDLIKYSHDRVMEDLLQVLDNFDRVTMSLENETDEKVKNIVVGIQMVKDQFLQTIGKHGLTVIESLGKTFDPNLHEAMGEEEAEGKNDQEIIKEFTKGYYLNGRVLRASKVIVAKNNVSKEGE